MIKQTIASWLRAIADRLAPIDGGPKRPQAKSVNIDGGPKRP